MKNLRVVFGIIRKYAAATGVANEDCFAALGKLPIAGSIFFPLYSYMQILYSLGYIKLSKVKKAILLTQKGKAVADVPYSISVLFTLLLYMLGRVVLLTILFTLFWPVLLFIPKQYNGIGEEKSTG